MRFSLRLTCGPDRQHGSVRWIGEAASGCPPAHYSTLLLTIEEESRLAIRARAFSFKSHFGSPSKDSSHFKVFAFRKLQRAPRPPKGRKAPGTRPARHRLEILVKLQLVNPCSQAVLPIGSGSPPGFLLILAREGGAAAILDIFAENTEDSKHYLQMLFDISVKVNFSFVAGRLVRTVVRVLASDIMLGKR